MYAFIPLKMNRSILQQLIPEAIITTYTEYDEASLLSVLEWADAVCIGSGLGRSDVADLIVNTVFERNKCAMSD